MFFDREAGDTGLRCKGVSAVYTPSVALRAIEANFRPRKSWVRAASVPISLFWRALPMLVSTHFPGTGRAKPHLPNSEAPWGSCSPVTSLGCLLCRRIRKTSP